jgi:hypothetical protein
MGGRLRAISAALVREICWLTLNCAHSPPTQKVSNSTCARPRERCLVPQPTGPLDQLEPIFYRLDNSFVDESRAILQEYAIVRSTTSIPRRLKALEEGCLRG